MKLVAREQLIAELSVLREHEAARVALRYDYGPVVPAQYDGARVERVGAYRRDYHAGHVRRHYGAAGRERVGGRAGRRRKYEAVGEEEGQRLAADLYLKVRDARDAALRYYEVVQRVELVDEPAGAPYLPLEQMAALERVMARYYRFYVFFGGFRAANREEAEPS